MIRKIVALLLLCLLLPACQTTRLDHEAIKSVAFDVLPEYGRYVEADPKLSPEGKKIRLIRIKTFQKLAEELTRE